MRTGTSSDSTSKLLGKPFWIWDKVQHTQENRSTEGKCCFNHIVGLPLKDKVEHPIYDYEKILYDSLLTITNYHSNDFKEKHLWVKKATGLGVTEFMLRLMAWLCTQDENFWNSQMCIVTGPNIDIATKLIKRLKGIFEPKLGITFSNKETVVELNGCTIEAYPSNHIDSFRALDNPKFILLDESDFFRKGEQEDVRHVSERYIGKSDPYIVMVSTPNAPGGLFYQIEQKPEETCLYKRLKMDWTVGVNRIYSEEEIEKVKHSPSFDREYGLQYLGKEGNVFSPSQIDKAVEPGEQFKHLPLNPYSITAIGCDVGFGSSNTAVIATQFLKEESTIRVIYAQEWEHGDPQAIVNLIFNLYLQYGTDNTFIWTDGSNRAFTNLLKVAFSESLNWEKRFLSEVDLSKGPILVSVQSIIRAMVVDHNSPKRERKEYMYYTTQWEAKNWLGNTIRHTNEAEGKYTQQTRQIMTRLNPQTGEHIQDYHMGSPRDAYTIPWDKKKANELLTSEKIFGEDSLNITNIAEVQCTVRFPSGNPGRTAFGMSDFLDLKYEKLQELSKTVKSPYLADLERRVNPYK